MKNESILNYAKEIGKQIPEWSQDGKALVVYDIDIEKLYYNNDNGRIATLISAYNDQTETTPLSELSREQYNDLIHEFIKKSNTPDSFKKTFEDIYVKGQINPGVILSDGRIVSGNRRFTVLRELYRETGNEKFRFFKCFILDKQFVNKADRKDIKTIERLTQFGVDERVDYSPIDRLVDIYSDLIGEDRMWTVTEYTKKLGLKKRDVDIMYYKAIVMADYLNYLNQPLKFYIAKEKKLDGPLQELWQIYRDINSEEEWNRIRLVFYTKFDDAGDRSRNVRELVRLYKKNRNRFDAIVRSVNDDIELKEIKEIKALTKADEAEAETITEKISDIFKLKDVVTDETNKQIFRAISETKIDEKKHRQMNALLDAFTYIMQHLDDTTDMADKNVKRRLREKAIILKDKLEQYLK